MKVPSELRGDVISREAAIEAVKKLRPREPFMYAHEYTARDLIDLQILPALSALPSVPEPPNDADDDETQDCECDLGFPCPFREGADKRLNFALGDWVTCDGEWGSEFRVAWISDEWECHEHLHFATDMTREPDTAPVYQTVSRFSDFNADSRWHFTKVDLSSAPTGLTRREEYWKAEAEKERGLFMAVNDQLQRTVQQRDESRAILTKEELDALIYTEIEQKGIPARGWQAQGARRLRDAILVAQLRNDFPAILESSSAPTPETEE